MMSFGITKRRKRVPACASVRIPRQDQTAPTACLPVRDHCAKQKNDTFSNCFRVLFSNVDFRSEHWSDVVLFRVGSENKTWGVEN